MAALVAVPAHAADQTILGSSLKVKNPSTPDKRAVQVRAKEKASPNTLVGNPVLSGATLTISANGTTPSQQALTLPPAFWSGDVGKGYKDKDSQGVNGPVKSARIRKKGSGNFTVSANLSGKLGTVSTVRRGARAEYASR